MSEHDAGLGGHGAAPTDPVGARNHYTLAPLAWLAGCSDRGRRHEINQDALALAGRDTEHGPTAVLVISDGVSTSPGSEVSAAVAAEVTCSTLVAMLRTAPDASSEQVQATLEDACRAANDAVLSSAGHGVVPGSCTLIAAVVNDHRITVGNIGDCRGYWIGDDASSCVLSVDDSVAQARIEMGMTREEAENGFQAHAITRWLGPDSRDATPRQVSLEVTGAGWLLLCSDGLWNYCSAPEQMAELVAEASSQGAQDPVVMAELLADWANQQGGRDNVTVAVARIEADTQGSPGGSQR